ncbi:hypothetical protein EGW08_017230, partial [Elysia chlorotica]
MMLLPRWWEGDSDASSPNHCTKLGKWIKRLEDADQAKMLLQRSAVASPSSCQMVVEEGAGESTLQQIVQSLLEMPQLDSDIVNAADGKPATLVSQYASLCQLLPLISTRL